MWDWWRKRDVQPYHIFWKSKYGIEKKRGKTLTTFCSYMIFSELYVTNPWIQIIAYDCLPKILKEQTTKGKKQLPFILTWYSLITRYESMDPKNCIRLFTEKLKKQTTKAKKLTTFYFTWYSLNSTLRTRGFKETHMTVLLKKLKKQTTKGRKLTCRKLNNLKFSNRKGSSLNE